MIVKTITTQGSLQQNCYILEKEDSCLIIDPGSEYPKIKAELEKEVQAILLTHRHFDHIGALPEFQKENRIPILEAKNLEEKEYQVGPFSFSVIKTKGHSKDSVTYYFKEEKMMFTGDFLFAGTVGRCDFEGGSWEEMEQSLDKIKKYPDEIIVYPGHEKKTTLGDEKRQNPYLNR